MEFIEGSIVSKYDAQLVFDERNIGCPESFDWLCSNKLKNSFLTSRLSLDVEVDEVSQFYPDDLIHYLERCFAIAELLANSLNDNSITLRYDSLRKVLESDNPNSIYEHNRIGRKKIITFISDCVTLYSSPYYYGRNPKFKSLSYRDQDKIHDSISKIYNHYDRKYRSSYYMYHSFTLGVLGEQIADYCKLKSVQAKKEYTVVLSPYYEDIITLETNHCLNKSSCFRIGGEYNYAPHTIGISYDSFVARAYNSDGQLKARCFGKLNRNELFAHNFYGEANAREALMAAFSLVAEHYKLEPCETEYIDTETNSGNTLFVNNELLNKLPTYSNNGCRIYPNWTEFWASTSYLDTCYCDDCGSAVLEEDIEHTYFGDMICNDCLNSHYVFSHIGDYYIHEMSDGLVEIYNPNIDEMDFVHLDTLIYGHLRGEFEFCESKNAYYPIGHEVFNQENCGVD